MGYPEMEDWPRKNNFVHSDRPRVYKGLIRPVKTGDSGAHVHSRWMTGLGKLGSLATDCSADTISLP